MHRYLINISPPKTGTTYLFNCFAETKEFNIPKLKEPKFLLEKVIYETNNLPEGLRIKSNYNRGINWYLSLFQGDVTSIKLDFTTLYNLNSKKIKNLPNSENLYLFILRDPFERLISHYYQYDKMGISQPRIEDIFKQKSSISEFYRSFINSERVLDLYKEDEILILNFDDIKNKNTKLVKYLNEKLRSKNFSFFDTNKYERGSAKYKFISKLIFNKWTSKMAKVLPNFLYVTAIKTRKFIIKKNTTHNKKIFKLSEDNCYFYNDLVREKIFQEKFIYRYK